MMMPLATVALLSGTFRAASTTGHFASSACALAMRLASLAQPLLPQRGNSDSDAPVPPERLSRRDAADIRFARKSLDALHRLRDWVAVRMLRGGSAAGKGPAAHVVAASLSVADAGFARAEARLAEALSAATSRKTAIARRLARKKLEKLSKSLAKRSARPYWGAVVQAMCMDSAPPPLAAVLASVLADINVISTQLNSAVMALSELESAFPAPEDAGFRGCIKPSVPHATGLWANFSGALFVRAVLRLLAAAEAGAPLLEISGRLCRRPPQDCGDCPGARNVHSNRFSSGIRAFEFEKERFVRSSGRAQKAQNLCMLRIVRKETGETVVEVDVAASGGRPTGGRRRQTPAGPLYSSRRTDDRWKTTAEYARRDRKLLDRSKAGNDIFVVEDCDGEFLSSLPPAAESLHPPGTSPYHDTMGPQLGGPRPTGAERRTATAVVLSIPIHEAVRLISVQHCRPPRKNRRTVTHGEIRPRRRTERANRQNTERANRQKLVLQLSHQQLHAYGNRDLRRRFGSSYPGDLVQFDFFPLWNSYMVRSARRAESVSCVEAMYVIKLLAFCCKGQASEVCTEESLWSPIECLERRSMLCDLRESLPRLTDPMLAQLLRDVPLTMTQ